MNKSSITSGPLRELSCTNSFLVALGSVLQETMRQAAPGKWISVVVLASVTGYSSNGNISGAVYNRNRQKHYKRYKFLDTRNIAVITTCNNCSYSGKMPTVQCGMANLSLISLFWVYTVCSGLCLILSIPKILQLI